MKLKGDVEWFERRLPAAWKAARLLMDNPGLEMRSLNKQTYIRGEILEGIKFVPVSIHMTGKYGELTWVSAWGWMERDAVGYWSVTDAGRAAMYEAYPDLPMLIEIRSAMYEAAKAGVLPTGPIGF